MPEIKLFIITYFAALAGVLPPGLVNMSVAKTCVKHGKRKGVIFALGSATTVFLQAFASIIMAKYIFNNPEIRRILLWIALVIFVTLGIYFFYKAYRHQKFDSKNIRPSKFTTRHYWGGFLIALINVFPIPYFVMLSTLFKHPGGEYSWLSIILFALAASLGCLTTFYVYVISFLKIEKHTTKFSTYSNYFMGGLMTVLTVIALFRLFISS